MQERKHIYPTAKKQNVNNDRMNNHAWKQNSKNKIVFKKGTMVYSGIQELTVTHFPPIYTRF